jgi:uncharacterized membrane protein YbaN (DUF454 family)
MTRALFTQVPRSTNSVKLGVWVNRRTRREVGVPSGIISVAIAVLIFIVWSFLLRLFVYPRFSRHRAENLQLARLVYSGVLAVALVFVAEMLTLSGPLEDPFILASAFCFAVSVPCLATMVLLITAAINGEAEQEWTAPVEWISAIGEVAFYAAIASVFFHYHWGAGVAFLVASSLVAYIGWAQLKPYVASEERPSEKQN